MEHRLSGEMPDKQLQLDVSGLKASIPVSLRNGTRRKYTTSNTGR